MEGCSQHPGVFMRDMVRAEEWDGDGDSVPEHLKGPHQALPQKEVKTQLQSTSKML